ncbi:MAG TPA: TonB-dependent receptor [Steroidobacteraceae bacterium]|nr:TonB-dependent receptor [Steroidobacteraceae bacterium]
MSIGHIGPMRAALILAASVTGLTGIAEAQTAAQSAPSGTLGEVIVTARKFEENLQTTPIAVTAFTGSELENRQIFRTDRLDEVVPNLQFANNAPLAGNNSSSAVFIRGIGQTDPTSTVDPGVGLYIDDVYMGTSVGANMELRDIASVQVLRGPQGTLFGRNTIGGAIVMTTKDPGHELGGELKLGGGSDSLIDAFGAIDVPFSENVRSRFTAGLRKQDGYVHRPDGEDLGDTNTYTLTAKLVFEPSDRFEGKFLADYTKSDENGSPLVFAAYNEAASFGRNASADAGCPGFTDITGDGRPDFNSLPRVPMIDDPRCANDFQNAGPYHNNGTAPLTSQLENWGGSLNLTFNLTGALALKSISSYRGISWEGNRDADNTPLPILHTAYDVDGWQWSQELQLLYQQGNIKGVFGAYYFDQGSDDVVTVTLNPPAPPPGPNLDSDNNKVENESWAVFTQWTFTFAEHLDLTVGGRYTEDKKGSFPDQFDYSTPNVKQVPVQWYRDTFSKFTPSGSIAWRFTEQAMVYASYSEGFKGGGWNSHFNQPPPTPAFLAVVQEFQPEEAETFEVGAKFDLAGNTLRLNVAGFTTDYKDLQVTYRGPVLPPPQISGVAPFLVNAGKASADGGELELTYAPTTDWILEASVGYLDAKLDELNFNPIAAPPATLVEGNKLPYAPEWQAHAGIQYTAHAGSILIIPRVDVSYQDTTFFDAANTPDIAQLDSITVYNASLRFEPEKGPWGVTLGVNNASDETYPIAGNSSLDTGSGYAEIAYSRPREYFAILTYDF